MKEKALRYYKQGYNCSQCILKAVEHKYNISVPKQCYSMCRAINNGLGIGGMCSVLTAGIMVFGLLYDDMTAKRLRMKLLGMFQEKYGALECGVLKRGRSGCDEIIADIASMIDNIIQDEGYEMTV